MSLFSRTFCAVLLLSLVSAAALARTPDGQPPSEESVCDVLAEPGVTPGLFGLCNAYCEAQDCHLYDVPTNSCQRLLDNYDRRADDDDPAMPCAQSCPCWTDNDLSLVDGLNFEACESNPFPEETRIVFNDGAGGQLGFAVNAEVCTYRNTLGGPGVDVVEPVDPDEEADCRADVESLIAEYCE